MKVKPALDRKPPLADLVRRDHSLLKETFVPRSAVKKILVPVDFSACSEKALLYALPLAEQFGAEITLLHVVPAYYAVDPYGLTQYERIESELRASGDEKLNALIVKNVPTSIKTQRLVCNGRVANEIVEIARKLKTDLIVISTHGYTGIKHVVFGSTAEHVVRNAPCPVLTVRARENQLEA